MKMIKIVMIPTLLLMITACDSDKVIEDVKKDSAEIWHTSKLKIAESAGELKEYLLDDENKTVDSEKKEPNVNKTKTDTIKIKNKTVLSKPIENINVLENHSNEKQEEISSTKNEKNMFSDWGEFKKWLREEKPYGPN